MRVQVEDLGQQSRIPEFIHFQKFQVIVIIWLAFSAVADSAITFALVWHLRRHKTGFASTDDVVNKIIRRE
ncbi:hypothetical protein PHLCEN_2v633 [Hermanssonia centrifuga]|uniref:Uncharacterized protein n=1 Tax=Hermanssonia centrifuga TaxID=98765 RepID=A0A2R6S5M3_9APHY|nr:hypothetical protein PHLCEN_2v633 [Hermanssonia centrifuga]